MINFTLNLQQDLADIISHQLLLYDKKYPNATLMQLISYYAKDISCPMLIIFGLYQGKFTVEEFNRIPNGVIFSILKNVGYSKIE